MSKCPLSSPHFVPVQLVMLNTDQIAALGMVADDLSILIGCSYSFYLAPEKGKWGGFSIFPSLQTCHLDFF